LWRELAEEVSRRSEPELKSRPLTRVCRVVETGRKMRIPNEPGGRRTYEV
jgi:hypothetical protein